MRSESVKRMEFFLWWQKSILWSNTPPDSTDAAGHGTPFHIYFVSVIPWAGSIKTDGQGSPGGLSERCRRRAAAVTADHRDTRRASVSLPKGKQALPTFIHATLQTLPPPLSFQPLHGAAKQCSSLRVPVCTDPVYCGYSDSNVSTWTLSNKKSSACSRSWHCACPWHVFFFFFFKLASQNALLTLEI